MSKRHVMLLPSFIREALLPPLSLDSVECSMRSNMGPLNSPRAALQQEGILKGEGRSEPNDELYLSSANKG